MKKNYLVDITEVYCTVLSSRDNYDLRREISDTTGDDTEKGRQQAEFW